VAPWAIIPVPQVLVCRQPWNIIALSDVNRDSEDGWDHLEGVCDKLITWVAWEWYQ